MLSVAERSVVYAVCRRSVKEPENEKYNQQNRNLLKRKETRHRSIDKRFRSIQLGCRTPSLINNIYHDALVVIHAALHAPLWVIPHRQQIVKERRTQIMR